MTKKANFVQFLLCSSALTLALAAPPAFAQEAADGASDEEVIVVRGIRGALQSAAQIKRDADTFVDSITASDVQTLPDLSVAEALGRIPGVTVSRFPSGGGASPDFPSPEGRGNLIRGLGFVRSEFNGRDAFSANGGRALDWSSIPPELVGGVDVYKNQSADLIEGGIGGTINLRTLEPFDRADHVFAIVGDATYSDLREEWSPSFSVLAGDRWETSAGEFGLLGSYSNSRLESMIHGWQQSGPNPRANWTTRQPTGADRGNEFTGVAAEDIIGTTTGFQLRTNEVDRDRTSYYIAGQWQNTTMRLTGKYARVETEINSLERTFEWWPEHDPGATLTISDIVIDENWSANGVAMCSGPGGFPSNPGDCETPINIGGGLMESGFVTNTIDDWTGAYGSPVGSLGIGKEETALTEDFSLNFRWNVTDQFYMEFDAQHTIAEATFFELWGGVNTYLNWQIDHDLDDPRIRFEVDPRTSFNPGQTRANDSDANRIASPTSMADPNGANWQFVADRWQEGTGELNAFRGDATYEFGGDSFFQAVKFGVRYSERSQVNSEMGLNWGAIAPAWSGGFGIIGSFQDPERYYETYDYSDFFRGGVVEGTNTSAVFINSDLLRNYTAMRNAILEEPQLGTNHPWAPRGNIDGTPNFNPQDISDIVEETQNAYFRLDFGGEFGNGMSLDGNIGVRYVSTDISSSGFISYRALPADTQTPAVVDDPDSDDPADVIRNRTDDAESRDDPRDFLPGAVAYSERAPVPISVTESDEQWLPSLNVRWNLNDEMLIRFGASKGLSRPNVQDLRASQEYVITTNRVNFPAYDESVPLDERYDRGALDITPGDIRVNRGNPYLLPTTAVSLDLSYEWYFEGGYFSAAIFDKQLENIINTGDMQLGTETIDGETVNVIYNGQVNQSEATISGYELAYQQFFDFLPGWMSNLGVQANYTWIDASAEPPGQGVDADGNGVPDDVTTVFRFGVDDMLGQSQQVANLVGIYQDDKMEVRLAYNWRSDYLTTYRDWVTGNPIYNEEAGFLDASFKYDFNDRLQFRVSAANLLDTKSMAYMQVNAEGQTYDRFSFLNDRRFVVGLRYQY